MCICSVCPLDHTYDVSQFLKKVKEPVSREAVQYLKREASQWLEKIRVQHGERLEHRFWQPGRGYDRNIERSGTLMNLMDYIHLNPVRGGLVQQPVEWKWFSVIWFAGTPINKLRPDPIP